MTRPGDQTPYRAGGTPAGRRRTVLIVLVAVLSAALGLALHVMGVLPPR